MAYNAPMTAETVRHTIEPVYDAHSEVLVLGTMPSPASREVGFYYGHPRNRFWRVMAELFDEPLADTNERRADQALRNHIAIWDVLASCTIENASDASIRDAVPNDIARIIKETQVKAVFCTGAKSAQLYRRLVEESVGIPCVQMPSTSPANASKSLEDLVEAYRAILPHLHVPEAPALPVAEVVRLERAIADSGTSLEELMERAGAWIAHRAHKANPAARIAVFCGSGNNGGDGWVAARLLARRGHDVALVTSRAPEDLRAQPAKDEAAATCEAGGVRILLNPGPRQVGELLADSDIAIDAILGMGFSGAEVKSPYRDWIGLANERRASGLYVIAADVPSGLNADTGESASTVVRADETVTMIVPKPGLATRLGPDCCGKATVASLVAAEGLLPRRSASRAAKA